MTTSPSERPGIGKILIANRGEIACRVIRTARRLGITTVAVYSEADRHALHVREADEAIAIGGSASSDSYLSIDSILEAVAQCGADAVHPGFGFLSENPRFATALEEAGITFIGPGVRAIEAMGDKITSKRLANEAGVNTVPGHPDAVADADEAFEVAEKIGCPVMLKASAGGGGKGMRVANSLDEVRAGFEAARNEAKNAFGDDRVFVEKFIEQPRHIEIQVIADTQGNTLYLHERECSIQRRHQKVIEEAPSMFISDETRKAMGEQAVALARAVDYRSAGTVEFIVGADESFYFLEMNTRLQVEHPVTEYITGLDIVELMIEVADGKALDFTQDEVALDGWSFEARVYAEDPNRGFLPSTGRVTHYRPPGSVPGKTRVRVDTGIDEGGEISMFYDPMIAKLVTWGPDRDSAIEAMTHALSHYRIGGVTTNIPFLEALFHHPEFRAGNLTTRFIEDHFADGFDSHRHEAAALEHLPLVAAWLTHRSTLRDRSGDSARRAPTSSVMAGIESAADHLVVLDATGRHLIELDRLQSVEGNWSPGDWFADLEIDGQTLSVRIESSAGAWKLSSEGAERIYRVYEPHVAELLEWMPEPEHSDQSGFLLSPMPGLLVKVLVEEGDRVQVGQELAVIEAMKMENTLRAEIEAVVKKVVASNGDSLAVDAVILEFET